ncbi:DUF6538 domain-containing protein [Acidocella sp.]|uniref:DUF6538 domain-containing protein n=1 Tax=Acidocella sp. TaxID=50710 RepID=UPI00344DC163
MSGCSYVERRGSRYYFRVSVPLDIAAIAGRTHVVAALGPPLLRRQHHKHGSR